MREFRCTDCGQVCMGPSGGNHRGNHCGCVDRQKEEASKERVRLGLLKLQAEVLREKRIKRIKNVVIAIVYMGIGFLLYPALNNLLASGFPYY